MPLSELILIVMGVLAAAMVAALICRRILVPLTVLLMVMGIVLGWLARTYPPFSPLLKFELTPELVLFLFLPGLIFESAFNLDARQLLKDIAPIAALALPALLLSTAIIGTGLWVTIDMGLMLALLFGALISATDPVAVIALFRELGAPRRLTVLVEGESLLNDATAIMLFHIILGLVIANEVVHVGLLGTATAEFLRVFVGGICVGILVGVPISLILFTPKSGLSICLVMSIVVAYASFAIAEHLLHVSGVMATLSAGIALAALGGSRIPQQENEAIRESWESIALVGNALLFIFVGISVDFIELFDYIPAIIAAIACVLLARAVCVYPMVPATVRLFRLPQITLGERHIMWWGGLKGGLAIAIVLSIPDGMPEKDMLLGMTIGVVLFTMTINATTIRPLIRVLGIDQLSDYERVELRHGLIEARQHAESFVSELSRLGLVSMRVVFILQNSLRKFLVVDEDQIDEELEQRQLFLQPLRREFQELKRLLDVGLVNHYTYLDMRMILFRNRETWLHHPEKFHYEEGVARSGLFNRLENLLLYRLREKDWATGILARYQYLRMSQSMQRDIAGVLIYTHTLNYIEEACDGMRDGPRNYLIRIYRERISVRKKRLAHIADSFPEFYKRFENALFAKVAYFSVNYRIREALHHGEIGERAYGVIDRRIQKISRELPVMSKAMPERSIEALISKVPLLNGLSPEILKRIAETARQVNFLAGDVIIGQGERGDALYILLRGKVSVYLSGDEDTPIAVMRDGDFFGEMALLGAQIRTANIVALENSRLARVSRRRILALAEQEQELRLRLERAMQQRQEAASSG